MNTGQVVVFDEETQMEIRSKALMSIPFVFAPVEIDGMQLIDGGTFQNVAVGDPIERCKNEEGVRDEDIIVDIILCL
jgi:predicted acylesterase/phospholipase RssA